MRAIAAASRASVVAMLLLALSLGVPAWAAAAKSSAKAPQTPPAPQTDEEPGHPAIPEPPEPPMPPDLPHPPDGAHLDVGGYTLRAGQTHVGDLLKAGPSVSIEGMQKGDVYAGGPLIQITGVVDGDAFLGGTEVSITGEVKKSVRVGATNTRVDGTVGGNLQCAGAQVTIGRNARIRGNLTVYSSQLLFEGKVDGAFKFKGGTATVAGKVGSNAEITADSIEIDPGAHIDGNLDYQTRERLGDDVKKVVAGKVSYNERRADDEDESDEKPSRLRKSFGVTSWVAFLTASFLFGCAMIAIFRRHEEEVVGTIRRDPLRCFGIGFVSVLVTIAVCLSGILLITIPFIAMYGIAYLILWYLARVPVALWLGRTMLRPLNLSVGPYLALLAGLIPLHLLFAIPYFGFLVHWILVPLLGIGAMLTMYLGYRQTQRAATVAAVPAPDLPPAAPLAS
ncbi:MAG TPA: polymer-forming cytoskeletal protein [Candidatus Sulfotelmatobacter sp.]|jgi:cytoskeletal protein CcmA (bactofilin family)|nr:polymer-forming cytoskeletal protein [Candidatus Sulfotelmatobacter sp.]